MKTIIVAVLLASAVLSGCSKSNLGSSHSVTVGTSDEDCRRFGGTKNNDGQCIVPISKEECDAMKGTLDKDGACTRTVSQ